MDDEWFILMFFITTVILIVGGVVIHEHIETPQDKCIDSCQSLSYDQRTFYPECMAGCMSCTDGEIIEGLIE